MGINYNIETEMCSLRKMCIVSVTQNILEIARRDPSTINNPKFIALKAAEMVPELDLPRTLNTEIVAIIRPVMEELLGWYQRYGDVARAIFTPHGTVDLTRSAKAIVASDQPVYQRFVTACEHCLEDDIFTLGKLVTSVMLQERSNPHAEFWYDVYGGNFDVKIIGGSLSQEQVVKGWLLAGPRQDISAIKYFHEKATLESIEVILDRIWNYAVDHLEYLYITPALCNTYLHDNVMDGEWLEKCKNDISTCLLRLLIKWPYQHLFLESTKLLMPNLSEWDFWDIAWNISTKLSADYKDYDYRSLFVRFWFLGLTSFKSKLLVNREVDIESLFENLLLVKDEFLVSLVFDQISETDEEYWYKHFNFILSCKCLELFYVKDYESLKLLMRLCRTKYLYGMDIAWNIDINFSADYKDYDYRSLFVGFWFLGLTNFKSKLLVHREVDIESLLENLLLVKDEFLVSLVFDQISETDEEYWYKHISSILSCKCLELFYVEDYESLDFLMRRCRTKYQLFIKFQNAFKDELIHSAATILDKEDDPYPFILDKYVQFMSNYWVLPELE